MWFSCIAHPTISFAMAEHGHGHITAASAHFAAASALADRIKSLVPKIYDIMKACKEKVAGLMMQPAVDEIVALCLQHDLAYKKNILGRHCGIHQENRAKTGVDPLNAQNLARNISLQGYSESKLENPMGFEKAAPGPAESAAAFFGRFLSTMWNTSR